MFILKLKFKCLVQIQKSNAKVKYKFKFKYKFQVYAATLGILDSNTKPNLVMLHSLRIFVHILAIADCRVARNIGHHFTSKFAPLKGAWNCFI